MPSPAAPAPPAAPASDGEAFADARSATAALVAAVIARDVPRFLACFSPRGKWALTAISGGKRNPNRYTFQQLEQGLGEGGDFRDVIFGYGADDNLRRQVVLTGDQPWRAKTPTTFTPPGEPRDVFVKWRREGPRFVVDEIAFPF